MSGVHLVADIGGTNARLALAKDGAPHDIRIFPTADIKSLEGTIQNYLAGGNASGNLTQLSIAAAGPVIGDRGAREIVWRHMDWDIREAGLREASGVKRLI